MRGSLRVLILIFLGILWLATGVFAAKLICISKETLRGEETINNCLMKGWRFALMESDGSVHVLSDEEIKLMKRLNPEAFKQPAYGIIYLREAPEIPKLPPLVVPKQTQ
jgi:hypothetical protein